MLRIMQLLSRVEEGENLGRCPALLASSGEPRCCCPPCTLSMPLHSRSFIPAQNRALGWGCWGLSAGEGQLFVSVSLGGQGQQPWCSGVGMLDIHISLVTPA